MPNARSRTTIVCGPIGLPIHPTVTEDGRRLYARHIDTTRQESVDVPNENTQEQARPAHLEPIDAYNRALVRLGHKLTEVTLAIERKSADLAGVGAHNAVGAWIAADAACKRLSDEIGEPHPLFESARVGLTECFEALLVLLRQAERQFTNRALKAQLTYLRESLELART